MDLKQRCRIIINFKNLVKSTLVINNLNAIDMAEIKSNIVTMAFVASVANPSSESAVFIVSIKKLIADTSAAYMA